MRQHTTLNGKSLQITLSRSAERALAERSQPLQAEMELYFSCLIRKQVRFSAQVADGDAQRVNEQLSVRFRPVMSQGCSVSDNTDGPPLADFPIVGAERFSPQWLQIDYVDGQWLGDFGY